MSEGPGVSVRRWRGPDHSSFGAFVLGQWLWLRGTKRRNVGKNEDEGNRHEGKRVTSWCKVQAPGMSDSTGVWSQLPKK